MGKPTNKWSFVERSKKNLQIIEEEEEEELLESKGFFEVTNLINHCLGLIVHPYEITNDNKQNKMQHRYKKREHKYGTVYLFSRNKKKTELEDFLYHMRNAICHGKIETNKEGDKITELHFHDYKKVRKNHAISLKENFYVVMSEKHVRLFIEDIYNKYTQQLK